MEQSLPPSLPPPFNDIEASQATDTVQKDLSKAIRKIRNYAIASIILSIAALFYSISSQANDAISTELFVADSPASSGLGDLFSQPDDMPLFISKVEQSIVDIACGGSGGTGFAFELDGLSEGYDTFIITNHHVIENCIKSGDKPIVKTGIDHDKVLISQIFDFDEENDLALIEIKGILPTISEAETFAERGWWAMAIGNPMDDLSGEVLFNNTTFGHITSVIDDFYNYTTATINRGNSGGPLLNSRGELIGINTWATSGQENGTWNIAVDSGALCLKLIKC